MTTGREMITVREKAGRERTTSTPRQPSRTKSTIEPVSHSLRSSASVRDHQRLTFLFILAEQLSSTAGPMNFQYDYVLSDTHFVPWIIISILRIMFILSRQRTCKIRCSRGGACLAYMSWEDSQTLWTYFEVLWHLLFLPSLSLPKRVRIVSNVSVQIVSYTTVVWPVVIHTLEILWQKKPSSPKEEQLDYTDTSESPSMIEELSKTVSSHPLLLDKRFNS